jgi:hypothetical protein
MIRIEAAIWQKLIYMNIHLLELLKREDYE